MANFGDKVLHGVGKVFQKPKYALVAMALAVILVILKARVDDEQDGKR